ncbi:MAG: nickel-dependent hydrogenase large subunit [Armatimonadetes bacterium]|nr:nickel-dependent hydrogenase large subunit [Armatimonadota bacterium]
MAHVVQIGVPLNRVEGDLDLRVELTDGVVTEAWCSGTMYRGFERMMVGRDALDGLVITPRICGMCTTAHLTAAVTALEHLGGITPPPDALRLRNVALMVEDLQNDLRHGFLMYAGDLANPRWSAEPFYPEAQRRFAPFAGETVIEVLRETKHVLEVVAILGGQWPHSSFMVPGGVVSAPGSAELVQCRLLVHAFRQWYEQRILGCSLERWQDVRSADDLDAWLDESPHHGDGAIGFWLRCARAIGLDRLGAGHGNYLSYGGFPVPDDSAVRGLGGGSSFIPAGFASGDHVRALDEASIAEDIASSWYDDGPEPRHPSQGKTKPYATGHEGARYSWAKAPRYAGLSAETGPLAEMVMGANPLITDLLAASGPSALTRQLARLVRPAVLLPAIETWLAELRGDARCYERPELPVEGEGRGLVAAARGALGHWIRVAEGRLTAYQIITPTGWHAGPRDAGGQRGYTEEALIGTPVADPDNPVELGHVVRSFDHCMVCTVHLVRSGQRDRTIRFGLAP